MQVNASPSLSTTTEKDQRLKYALIRDVFRVVLPKQDAMHNVGEDKGSVEGEGAAFTSSTSTAAAGATASSGGGGGGGGSGSKGGSTAPASSATTSGFQAQLEVLVSNRWTGGIATCTDNIVGGFELLYDETIDIALEKIRTVEGRKATGPARWR